MAKPLPLMLLPPLIFAGFVGLAAVGMLTGDDELEAARVGQIAPAMTAEALPGYEGVVPADFARGEVTRVNFWASWCPPCRAEHPRLLEMAAEGVPIIGVNFRDKAAAASAYLEETGNPFVAVPFDPEGRSAFDWGVTAPPETFILDAEGEVLFRFIGPLVGSDFEQRFLPEFQKAVAAEAERLSN